MNLLQRATFLRNKSFGHVSDCEPDSHVSLNVSRIIGKLSMSFRQRDDKFNVPDSKMKMANKSRAYYLIRLVVAGTNFPGTTRGIQSHVRFDYLRETYPSNLQHRRYRDANWPSRPPREESKNGRKRRSWTAEEEEEARIDADKKSTSLSCLDSNMSRAQPLFVVAVRQLSTSTPNFYIRKSLQKREGNLARRFRRARCYSLGRKRPLIWRIRSRRWFALIN